MVSMIEVFGLLSLVKEAVGALDVIRRWKGEYFVTIDLIWFRGY